jgi:alpha-tubulin suppressor-like RCC1 family protein
VFGLAVGLLLSACGSGPSKSNKVMAVAAGYRHTCVLTGVGGVRCWGANEDGQLGNGTTFGSTRPVGVSGLASGVVAIAAGGQHTCAITGAGGVKCWGYNNGGQLGNATKTNSSTPVDVRGLASGVTAIAAGAGSVCALTSAGGVKCWGWKLDGRFGNGPTSDQTSTTPVDIKGLASGVSAISANNLHACALTNAGHVKCWGSTTSSSATNSNVPADVRGLGDGFTEITAGGLHACAITSSGGVKCWGDNAEGELGNGSNTSSNSPVGVSGLTRGATALAVGSTSDYVYMDTHTCALTSVGGVKCWGPNRDGQLGNGSTTSSSRPVEVSGLDSGIIAVAVGGSHTCAITRDRRLKCWGDNSTGQLGNGSMTNSPTPVDVVGL